ncbi:chorismate-binding protein [bacterium]|nr:chorismate-binding protein [bacterium]
MATNTGESEVLIERWENGRARRVRAGRIEETLTAWTPDEAVWCLDRIDAGRKTLRRGRPWESGWIGFVSYELGRMFLPGLTRSWRRQLPLLRFHRVSACKPVSEPASRGSRIRAKTAQTDDRESYGDKIFKIRKALQRGDAYEVNLSQRWEWRYPRVPDARRIFDRASRLMHPRFGFFERTGASAILGFSPELFFSVRKTRIQAEPVKGTAGTGERGLVGSAKDRAELLMITDLFRNDLGKICRTGSIHAEGPIEMRIPYARHLFSRVSGHLRKSIPLIELLAAVFPSGSVTGAPKISACRIIDSLEPFAREESFGAYGWIGRDDMEFAVAIRTAAIVGRVLRYTAGGGITIYSDPEKEYEESLLKAGRFFEALGACPQRAMEKFPS